MYVVRGEFHGSPREDVDETEVKSEAERLLKEKRMTYGPERFLAVKKRRNEH